jgi:hypothetical protein
VVGRARFGVAGAGGAAAHDARRGSENGARVAGAAAGTGPTEPAADRVAGRAGSVRLRERAVARTASHPRRPRVALYLASWTAVRRAGMLRTLYEDLVRRGKARQLALIAVARRMLLVLNEMMRTGRDWRDNAIPA